MLQKTGRKRNPHCAESGKLSSWRGGLQSKHKAGSDGLRAKQTVRIVAMTLTTPEWLTRHDGTVKLGSDGSTWYVLLAGKPQYALLPRPVGDKFGCQIKQTNNGTTVTGTAKATGREDALQEGLEDLRKALGW
jgi:hypothetical protein